MVAVSMRRPEIGSSGSLSDIAGLRRLEARKRPGGGGEETVARRGLPRHVQHVVAAAFGPVAMHSPRHYLFDIARAERQVSQSHRHMSTAYMP